ncbi:ABC transporter permease [Rhodohalobacter barkolensis]|uniref:ABC transporter permease n=1 Tax=Rhodohalobacter barkolensis TaxID=2053187 RepID=A0A2N0VJY5_9BACT|nr:FtsX-like permease family protein [Rhodohalobacter barkolensis]PKD44464.1 ABC transporter permease [Rhodohalobacter barkolensis]
MNRFPILKIVITHLTSRKRQTIVSMLGVTFGITVFIFQAGVITGLQDFFIEKTINSTAHIQIYQDKNQKSPPILRNAYSEDETWISVQNIKSKNELPKLKRGLQIVEILESYPEVTGVSPSLSTQAIFKIGVADVSGIINGVDIRKENRLFDLEQDMVSGSIIRLETVNNGIILGSGLAESLGAILNDNITVVSPGGVALQMKVVGILNTGLRELDDSRAYSSIRNAQKLMNVTGNYITNINIKLADVDQSSKLASEFQTRFGYTAEDWKVTNEGIFSVFRIQNIVTYLVIISILLVSGFGIFNILSMMIYEKMNDIAILKSIGYTDIDIRNIFLQEALIIGFIGGIFGLMIGFVLSWITSIIPTNIEGFVSSEYLNINFDPVFYLMAFVFGLVATGIAGYLPAKKASKIDPINIIRSN